MAQRRGDSRLRPEGPFENTDTVHLRGVIADDLALVLDFIDALADEADRVLSMRKGYDETRLLTSLLRNHLTGKVTTTSSLAHASGLGYGTAIRAIRAIEARGLLFRRPRTGTGKSFALHPSRKLICEWQEYARRVRGTISSTLRIGAAGSGGADDYYFGASYVDSKTILPPAPLSSKLDLQRELRMLVHADPTFMAMNVLKRQFEGLFGVNIRSRALSIDRLRREIIANSRRKTSQYDIIACDLPWFGELAQGKILRPIDDLIGEHALDLSDFHDVALASARFEGRQYGLPVQTTPELLVARRDLFADAGVNLPFTIEDTLKAARRLHKSATEFAGIAWNAARGTPLGHSFMFIMGAMGRPFLNLARRKAGLAGASHTADSYDGEWVAGENCRPVLLCAEAYETAEYCRALLSCSPASILSMSWYERARAYADGQVAMAYCATLLAPLFELDRNSPAFGVTEFLPHPHGLKGRPIAPVGGYALAIPSNIEAARLGSIWTALQSLTSPESIKLYIENGSLVSPRFSVSLDPDVRRVSPVISIVDGMARTGVLQYWPRPPIPEITQLIAIIGEEMHDLLQGLQSVRRALTTAQNRADALMRARGHY